jgi:protein SCO1
MGFVSQTVRRRAALLLVAAFAFLSLFAAPPVAASKHAPDPLDDVRFDQLLGAPLPLDVALRDENGRDVRLGDYFGTTPVLLVPGYFRCPTLCPVTRDGVLKLLDQVGLELGREFTVLSFSIDPRESPADALALQQEYAARFSKPGFAEGWHFLTGTQDAIAQITEAIGFTAVYDELTDQYSHAAGIVVATPEGTIARYFYGIDYVASDVRLGLVEASQNKIGSIVDQLFLLCYRYDPASARYTPLIMTIMRIGFVLTTLALGIGLFWMSRQSRQPPTPPAPVTS